MMLRTNPSKRLAITILPHMTRISLRATHKESNSKLNLKENSIQEEKSSLASKNKKKKKLLNTMPTLLPLINPELKKLKNSNKRSLNTTKPLLSSLNAEEFSLKTSKLLLAKVSSSKRLREFTPRQN
jgi:CRISPR/Cas system CMR subunit Cmr6 (Cas7 group RAMP superfamily)